MDFDTKNSIQLVLKAIEEAYFHLNETGEFESEALDSIFEDVKSAKTKLGALLHGSSETML